MDIGRVIRDRVKRALDGRPTGGRTNIAISATLGGEHHSTVVYSDDEVTIIERDGERQVIRHRPDPADGGTTG